MLRPLRLRWRSPLEPNLFGLRCDEVRPGTMRFGQVMCGLVATWLAFGLVLVAVTKWHAESKLVARSIAFWLFGGAPVLVFASAAYAGALLRDGWSRRALAWRAAISAGMVAMLSLGAFYAITFWPVLVRQASP